jgi:hypothetical protein
MSFATPADLAQQVMERWESFAARSNAPPPLPSPGDLKCILEAAFFASLEREEGRALRFVLCCAPEHDVVRDGLGERVPIVPLATPRPLTVESIRSLAPAVNPMNAALLIRFPAAGGQARACEIAGVLHVGENVGRARSGRAFYYRPAPYALAVEVLDAGELHVYQGGARLAAIEAGRLHDLMAFSTLEFLPLSPILASGEESLRPRIAVPEHEPSRETSDFQWTALLNTILCIVNGVRAHGHGGTVLLVAPDTPALPIRTKFAVAAETTLSDRYVEFVNTRHVLAEAWWRQKSHPDPNAERALAHLQNAAFAAEEDLVDAAAVVAGLTAIDGALVLTADLRVAGFGAEIILDSTRAVNAHEVRGSSTRPSDYLSVDGESFGMRHRSALRFVAFADRTAAFVVSQDGQVSLFWRHRDEVLIRRNVNTANPNMIGK